MCNTLLPSEGWCHERFEFQKSFRNFIYIVSNDLTDPFLGMYEEKSCQLFHLEHDLSTTRNVKTKGMDEIYRYANKTYTSLIKDVAHTYRPRHSIQKVKEVPLLERVKRYYHILESLGILLAKAKLCHAFLNKNENRFYLACRKNDDYEQLRTVYDEYCTCNWKTFNKSNNIDHQCELDFLLRAAQMNTLICYEGPLISDLLYEWASGVSTAITNIKTIYSTMDNQEFLEAVAALLQYENMLNKIIEKRRRGEKMKYKKRRENEPIFI